MDTSKSQELVGVVDVTASRDWSVLEYLPPDADEFLYVSGIAVLKSFRFSLSQNTNLLCMVQIVLVTAYFDKRSMVSLTGGRKWRLFC